MFLEFVLFVSAPDTLSEFDQLPPFLRLIYIREVKHDVYGKQQTAKMKLFPSVLSSLYSSIIKIFLFAVNSKRHRSIFAVCRKRHA